MTELDKYIQENFGDHIQDTHLNLSNMIDLDEIVILYAQNMRKIDSDDYEFCMSEIDFDELHNALVDNEINFINAKLNYSKQLIINEFKKDLEHRISNLQGELEDQEELDTSSKIEAEGINSEFG